MSYSWKNKMYSRIRFLPPFLNHTNIEFGVSESTSLPIPPTTFKHFCDWDASNVSKWYDYFWRNLALVADKNIKPLNYEASKTLSHPFCFSDNLLGSRIFYCHYNKY